MGLHTFIITDKTEEKTGQIHGTVFGKSSPNKTKEVTRIIVGSGIQIKVICNYKAETNRAQLR